MKIWQVYYWKDSVNEKGEDVREMQGKRVIWDYGKVEKAALAYRCARGKQMDANRLVFERIERVRPRPVQDVPQK